MRLLFKFIIFTIPFVLISFIISIVVIIFINYRYDLNNEINHRKEISEIYASSLEKDLVTGNEEKIKILLDLLINLPPVEIVRLDLIFFDSPFQIPADLTVKEKSYDLQVIQLNNGVEDIGTLSIYYIPLENYIKPYKNLYFYIVLLFVIIIVFSLSSAASHYYNIHTSLKRFNIFIDNFIHNKTKFNSSSYTPPDDELGDMLNGFIDTLIEVNRLSVAVKQNPASIVITDIDGTIQYVNPAFTEITGYSYDEAIGQNPRVLKSGRMSDDFYVDMWQTISTGEVFRGDIINKRKDGSFLWENITVAPIFDNFNRIINYVAVKEDVSHRKETEQKLSELNEELKVSIHELNQVNEELTVTNEELNVTNDELNSSNAILDQEREQFLRILDGIPELIYVADKETNEILFANKRLSELIGRNPIGEKCYKAIQGKEEVCSFCSNFIIYSTGKPYYWNFHNPIFDRDFYIIDQAIKWTDSREVRFELAIDITDIRRMEEQLKSSEEKYRLLAENLSDVIWVLNLTKEKYTYISPSIYNLRGYTVEEAMNQSIEESLTEESAKIVIDSIEKNVKEFLDNPDKEIYYRHELRQPCKNGDIIWIETSTRYRFNKNKEIEVVGISRNITARKNYQITLEETKKKLEDLNATKDKFFSIIAHDLKNPFSGILGLTKILKEDSEIELSTEDYKEIGETIYTSADTAYKLLENLLEWSRSQTGTIKYNPFLFNLKNAINSVISINKSLADNKKITINKEIDDIDIFADINMLNTIIRNLLTNAIKFTREGGVISVISSVNKYEVMIKVIDNGVGINKNIIDKLFKINNKISTVGTNKEHGTGLGLLLCKEFVDKHGGIIGVESEEGKGSTFYFTIPIPDSIEEN